MPVALKLNLKDLKLLDLIMTGEAARLCGVDRRTFWKKAQDWKVEAIAHIEGKAVYKREVVERMAERIKKERAAKK